MKTLNSDNSKKRFESKEHSLHKKTISNTESYNKYRLFIGPFNNQDPKFQALLNELYESGEKDLLELRIMSPGGLVIECQQIVNLMNNKFKGRTTAYIESHASSAGAFTFAHADKRVVYENSRLMFHNYSGGYAGKYQDIKDRLEFDEKHIIDFLKVAKQFLTKKEWKKMVEGKNFWFDAKDMLERGIATHIVIDGQEMTYKKYKKYLKKKGNK